MAIVRAFCGTKHSPSQNCFLCPRIGTFGRGMTKRTQAKYRLDRKVGENLWGRTKSPVNRRSYGPGQHGQRRSRKLSDYGTQLAEKQKLKGYYANITERQFRGYYEAAARKSGDTGEHMIGLLERRLDTVVFRAKFVPTPYAARQLVSHGHVAVNGKRVTVSSYLVKEGDLIELRGKAKDLAMVLDTVKSAEREVPEYIDANHSKMTAKYIRVPLLAEVPYAVVMQPSLVVEFYSR